MSLTQEVIKERWDTNKWGFFHTTWDVMYDQSSPKARAVHQSIARKAGSNLVCWPSIQDIMHDQDLSRQNVKTALAELERKRWIAIEPWRYKTPEGNIQRAPSTLILYPLCREYTEADLKVRVLGFPAKKNPGAPRDSTKYDEHGFATYPEGYFDAANEHESGPF